MPRLTPTRSNAATDRDESKPRQNLYFLSAVDHAGQVADFHALRYPCVLPTVRQGNPEDAPTLDPDADPRAIRPHPAK